MGVSMCANGLITSLASWIIATGKSLTIKSLSFRTWGHTASPWAKEYCLGIRRQYWRTNQSASRQFLGPDVHVFIGWAESPLSTTTSLGNGSSRSPGPAGQSRKLSREKPTESGVSDWRTLCLSLHENKLISPETPLTPWSNAGHEFLRYFQFLRNSVRR